MVVNSQQQETGAELMEHGLIENGLPFVKMSGCGNTFVLIDLRDVTVSCAPDIARLARDMCNANRGVGADGMMVLDSSLVADARLTYYNRDGSSARLCGNGSRCAAMYLWYRQGSGKPRRNEFLLETEAGMLDARITGPNRVNIGIPRASFHVLHGAEDDVKEKEGSKAISLRIGLHVFVNGSKREIHFVNTGVPHAVVMVEDIGNVEVVRLGRELRNHERFAPDGTNVNFVQCMGQRELVVRTYERGVEDETLACGTGAVASALVAAALGRVRSPVEVTTRGGEILTVTFQSETDIFKDVCLEGDARILYTGTFPC